MARRAPATARRPEHVVIRSRRRRLDRIGGPARDPAGRDVLPVILVGIGLMWLGFWYASTLLSGCPV
jgi:hypothetical protein